MLITFCITFCITIFITFFITIFFLVNRGPEFAICPQDVELNRRSDAWIPRQATSQILSGIASSAPGASYPDRSALTAPAAAIRDNSHIMSAMGGSPKCTHRRIHPVVT